VGAEVTSSTAALTNAFKVGDKVQLIAAGAQGEVMTVHGITSDGRISVFSSMCSTETLHDHLDFVKWPNPWTFSEAAQVAMEEAPVSHIPEVAPEATPIASNFLDDLIAKAHRALEFQTGGSHYQRGTIQPIEFFHDNDIPFAEASAMKYIYRWKSKGGKQDLQKAIQICLQLIAMEDRKAIRKANQ
jgi:hypothetical protein